MVPVREGFNWAGYITPFVAVGVGAAVAATLMWRWRRAAAQHSTGSPPAFVAPAGVEATPEELARLDAAIRDDR
jgi:cytochrome c-type biogenesis protein CcmH